MKFVKSMFAPMLAVLLISCGFSSYAHGSPKKILANSVPQAINTMSAQSMDAASIHYIKQLQGGQMWTEKGNREMVLVRRQGDIYKVATKNELPLNLSERTTSQALSSGHATTVVMTSTRNKNVPAVTTTNGLNTPTNWLMLGNQNYS